MQLNAKTEAFTALEKQLQAVTAECESAKHDAHEAVEKMATLETEVCVRVCCGGRRDNWIRVKCHLEAFIYFFKFHHKTLSQTRIKTCKPKSTSR